MLDDGRCLFIVDELCRLEDEFLRVVLELVKDSFLNPCQDLHDRVARQAGFFHQFADQVIFHGAVDRNAPRSTVPAGVRSLKGFPGFEGLFGSDLVHLAFFHAKVNLSHVQVPIQRLHAVPDKFFAVKFHRVYRFGVDALPERLKLRHGQLVAVNL